MLLEILPAQVQQNLPDSETLLQVVKIAISLDKPAFNKLLFSSAHKATALSQKSDILKMHKRLCIYLLQLVFSQ